MDKRDPSHIIFIARYLQQAVDFVGDMSLDEYLSDIKTQMAVAMAVSQAGEHVKKLSKAFREEETQADWRGIAGIRDWIVHDYDHVEQELLYKSVMREAPRVIKILQPFISQFEKQTKRLPDFPDLQP